MQSQGQVMEGMADLERKFYAQGSKLRIILRIGINTVYACVNHSLLLTSLRRQP